MVDFKYPSEPVLLAVATLWKIFVSIEKNDELVAVLVECPFKKILVELALIFLKETDADSWRLNCSSCEVSNWNILEKIIFTAANCFIANKMKNYNSLVISKGVEKRKLKKFS